MGPLATGLLLSALLTTSAAGAVDAAQDTTPGEHAAGAPTQSEGSEGSAKPDSPSVEAVLANARATIVDLEYDRAASLLTEVIVDEQASDRQLTEARWLLAEVEVIRGFNSEARAHYEWLLDHDPDFTVPEAAPPKVSGFFRLVRDDWQRSRDAEARLLAAAEQGKRALEDAAALEEANEQQEEEQRAQHSVGRTDRAPPRGGDEQAGDAPAPTRDREGRSARRAPQEPSGSPDLLSATIVAYAMGALGALCFCGPGLAVLLTTPTSVLGATACIGGSVITCCSTSQGLGTVFLGDTMGNTRSRWAYVTTLLASIATFIVGGLTVGAIGAAGVFGLGALFALTSINEDVFNSRDTDAAFAASVVLTAVVAVLFTALQPIIPALVYAFHGGDADAADANAIAHHDHEVAPVRRRVAAMSF